MVLELVDLLDGRTVEVVALENPQRFGGSDVINRISYDETDESGALRQVLRRALNRELQDLYERRGIDRREVYEVVVVGNATMRDLFFGLDVAPIGQRPYKSVTELELLEGRRDTTALTALAHELGVRVNPKARVWGAPLIASHVGADVAADLVAIGLDGTQDGVHMLIDVGTNTEVVLAGRGRILTASCPAGPAFEGGSVTYGMQAAEGAIETLRPAPDGTFAISTIGDAPPDRPLRLRPHRPAGGARPRGPHDAEGRVRRPRARRSTCTPRPASPSRAPTAPPWPRPRPPTRSASGSCCASSASTRREVDRLYLAGGFASYVDPRNAIDIGFLAPVPVDRIEKVGNASLRGARRLLLSATARARLAELLPRIEHLELETTPDFFELFVDACQFKPLPDELAPGGTRR